LLQKWETGEKMEKFETKHDATTEVSIRVTTTKDGSKIAEYTVKGNPNTATGKAAWYWGILDAVIRETGIGQEKRKGLFNTILGGN
jgi:hypothetical protein